MWHLEKIPKIAHFYWGEPTLPWLRFLTIESFVRYNPEWEVRYYYPTEYYKDKSWVSFEQKYEITGKDYSNKLPAYGVKRIAIDFNKRFDIPNTTSEVHKSDYLRWYLLSRVGGFWSDMDIIYFKGMKELSLNTKINKEVNTIVCNNLYGNSIGFMLSSEGNPYYRMIWDKAKSNFDADNYQCVGSLLVNSIFPTITSISQRLPKCIVRNLPMDAVYAYNARMIPIIYDTCDMTHFKIGSIGLHWYAGHPKAAKLINEVDDTNYLDYPSNVITETAKISSHTKLIEAVKTLIPVNSTVLDIGCGNKMFSNNFLNKAKITTLDVWPKFKPDILHNLEDIPLPIASNSYDVVIAVDIIEHLSKNKGLQVMEELKRITKKYIIVLTPLWWTDNHENVQDTKSDYYGNIFNNHKSLWSLEDFKDWHTICKLGYLEKYFFGYWRKS